MSLALIRANTAVELNPEQQRAVEHGLGQLGGPSALLVIAGAGSGKTAMLAHRVAALILAASCSRPSRAEPQPSSTDASSES